MFGLHTSWPEPRLQSVGSDSGPDLQNVVVDGNPVDLVESFTYLGSIQTSGGYCRSDITRRIGIASSAMSPLSNIWNTKHLSIQTKVHVYQTFVLPINTPAHRAMLRQVKLSVGQPPDPSWKVHQVDPVPNGPTNSAAITTMFPLRLWRQAIGRGHSRATLRSEPTTC